jgi:phosphoribosylformimino-5-aminoimidazole carboxamide ribonucleotide (ProFAR) isomerase
MRQGEAEGTELDAGICDRWEFHGSVRDDQHQGDHVSGVVKILNESSDLTHRVINFAEALHEHCGQIIADLDGNRKHIPDEMGKWVDRYKLRLAEIVKELEP